MNPRVILLVLLIVLFSLGGAIFSLLSFETSSLSQAYQDGNVVIIQSTPAGTVPHVVTVKNTGKKPLMVEHGQILNSSSSQDLVIAENKRVDQNSSENVKAYCYEPKQKAVPGSKLTPGGQASSQIKSVIENSNPSDIQNATPAQLQIWILVTGDNVDINTGEGPALIQMQQISQSNLNQQISTAKSNLITVLNITSSELKNINQNNSQSSLNDFFNQIINWINGFIDWIRSSLGISL